MPKDGGLRIVLIYAAICLVVFILQRFPITGIVLMFLLAPLWITGLVHLMMLHLGLASIARKISRKWLVLPAVFYGANVVAFGVTYLVALREAAHIERENSAAKVEAVPPLTFLLHGYGPGLIASYRIDRLYQHEGEYSFSAWKEAQGAGCDADKLSDGYRVAWRSSASDACILTRSGLPADTQYHYDIARKETVGGHGLMSRSDTVWTVIEEKTGRVVTKVRTARIASWSPLPAAFIGCFLNSGNASWDCGVTFFDGPSVLAGYKEVQSYYGMSQGPVDPERLEANAVIRALSIPLRERAIDLAPGRR